MASSSASGFPAGGNSVASRDVASMLHPYTDLQAHQQNGPFVVARGEGVHVFDEAGAEYIDSLAGLWCASLGFNNQALVDAATRQLIALPFYHGFTGRSSEPQVELAEMLLARAPVPMARVFFANSGSEANDTAIKMIWYYNNALGRPQKKKIIARHKAYHGTTVGAASLSGLAYNHRSFDAPLPGFLHTTTPHFYHEARDGESEQDFATRCAEDLEQLIQREGPDTVAAFFAEPIIGAGGVILPPATYFEKIQAVLRRHDILFVADEVICGFHRTANCWGSQTFNLTPDILTCAKALSAAYMPISAVMVNQRVFDVLSAQSHELGTFGHGFTYSGHPVAAAVAVETLRQYDALNIQDHVRAVAPHLQHAVRSRFADHPMVGEVRGTGLVAGIELVADRNTRRNFDPKQKIGPRMMKTGLDHKIILRALPNDTIGISPPLIITAAEIDVMLTRLAETLDNLAGQLKKEAG